MTLCRRNGKAMNEPIDALNEHPLEVVVVGVGENELARRRIRRERTLLEKTRRGEAVVDRCPYSQLREDAEAALAREQLLEARAAEFAARRCDFAVFIRWRLGILDVHRLNDGSLAVGWAVRKPVN